MSIRISHKGSLAKFSYSAHDTESKRHSALNKAVKADRKITVEKRLNAVAVLNKNRNPRLSSIFNKNKNYVIGKMKKG